nr:hypothetical protein [uncultured Bacteroides sp.]
MANKVITMLRIRRMLQLLEKGLSLRKISKELEMGRNTISDYHARIGNSGKSYQELLSLSDNSLSKILLPVKDEIRFFVTLGASKQFQMLIQSRFYMLFDKPFIESDKKTAKHQN